jgi:hypothetical protein
MSGATSATGNPAGNVGTMASQGIGGGGGGVGGGGSGVGGASAVITSSSSATAAATGNANGPPVLQKIHSVTESCWLQLGMPFRHRNMR